MIKKIAAVAGTAILVAALGLFVVGTVFAEGPTPTPSAQAPKAGPPPSGAWGRICRGAGIVSDAVAKLLGLTHDQIMVERRAGKTLAEIAKEQGVTDQQVIDAIVAGRKEVIDQAIKDGKLTQAQADWLLARAKAMAPFALSNPFTPGAGRGMRGDPQGWPHRAGGPQGHAKRGPQGQATPTP